MHEATGHLLKMRDELKTRYRNDFFKVPYPTMNLGNIHGGDAINRICACCELQLDMRPLPHLAVEDLHDLLLSHLAPMLEKYGDLVEIRNLHGGIPGYECEHSAQIVQVVEKLLGVPCESANYCTEAPYIQQLCPTLVLGPGSIEQAHQVDEFLETRYIEPTQALLTKLIQHFCF